MRRLIFRAASPLPTIQERKKSSMAEYRTSSTDPVQAVNFVDKKDVIGLQAQ